MDMRTGNKATGKIKKFGGNCDYLKKKTTNARTSFVSMGFTSIEADVPTTLFMLPILIVIYMYSSVSKRGLMGVIIPPSTAPSMFKFNYTI